MRKLIVNEPQTEGRRGVTSSSSTLEDVRVGVRLKISALWIAMLFLFAYGDIFGFFNPGQIEEVISGEISGIEITQVFLLAVSVYIAIASVMIFLSLVLRPTVCRWTNIVLAILYSVSIVAFGDRRDGRVLPVPQHHRDRDAAAHRQVRVDVAPAGWSRRPHRSLVA